MQIFKDYRIDKYLKSLSDKDYARIFKVIDLLRDYGFKLHDKYLKKLTAEIWEIRAQKYRLLFGISKDGLTIVHIFYKKTQKTPKKDLKLAIERLKQYL